MRRVTLESAMAYACHICEFVSERISATCNGSMEREVAFD
jgi:hypothetical protein